MTIYLLTINKPTRTKNKMKGNNTKNHAKLVAPARHIRFNIQVQNKMYSVLIKKIKKVLETSHVYDPTQYLLMFPKF